MSPPTVSRSTIAAHNYGTRVQGVLAVTRKWLWHKDREVVTYSYGSPRDIMIAIL